MLSKLIRHAEQRAPYKHECLCRNGAEYLYELPKRKPSCAKPKYYRRTDDGWVDITTEVLSRFS